jgi:DNA-directed RNA polymerase subunit RPC12/RpoP
MGYLEAINRIEGSTRSSSSNAPGEGPCSKCGRRLWFKDLPSPSDWQCHHCRPYESHQWQEVLYVPETWKPVKAGEPGVLLRCVGCQRAVSTLIQHRPGQWRCGYCIGPA